MELKTIFSNVEPSLYGEYLNQGGKKTKEEFNSLLFSLID